MTRIRLPGDGGGDAARPGPNPDRQRSLIRRARFAGSVGAVWGVVAVGYLLSRWIDTTTTSMLHNPTARRADIGWGVLALLVALVAAVAVVRASPRALRVLLPILAPAYGVAAMRALDASPRRDRLASELLFTVPPTVLLLAAAVLVVVATAHHPLRVAIEAVAVVSLVAVLLGATLLRDPASEARVFAGLLPYWQVEREVDNAFVDDAGVVWGVRPWALAETAGLYRFDDGRFLHVADRDDGWPPTVVGTLADGGTVMVSSARDNPFEPIFEVHRDGAIERLPTPQPPLPPLDGIAVDAASGRVFGLHSDFAVPARAVLEIFDDGEWETVDTPLEHAGRLASVDVAVDRRGRLWVWHGGEPATIHRFDGREWTSARLPFRARSATDVAALPLTMDPFDTFLPDGSGNLWLFDSDRSRLATLAPDDSLTVGPVLPEDCVPVTLDHRRRVWCREPGGLTIVGRDGAVLYDTRRSGLPTVEVVSVAVGAEHAWVLVQRGEGQALLRFDHSDALGDAP
jgi:hypothetical protein